MGEDLGQFLPDVYKNSLALELKFSAPGEPRSTCDDCAMCEGPKNHSPINYKPSIKCCSYFPKIPNYLVGAALADESAPLGKTRINERIRIGHGVSPWGIVPDRRYELFAKNHDGAFGRSDALLCPYYERETGHCGVWRHRNSVCSTYFCKHEAGKVAQDFWMAFKKYLVEVERKLGLFAVLELHPSVAGRSLATWQDTGEKLSPSELDYSPQSPGQRRQWWGKWDGKVETFYAEAHKLIAALSFTDVESIVGIEGKVRLKQLLGAHKRMTAGELPARLKFNPQAVVGKPSEGKIPITTYSKLNPLVVSESEFANLKSENAASCDESFRRRAYQYGVLVER